MTISNENQHWLNEWQVQYGRAPRVLHIGNIANNAYNNAKLLNEVGLDCDVICYDYYHIMGCPEWEDADISKNHGDQFKPDWVAAGIKDFRRPRWFAQGPAQNCIEYLYAKRKGRISEANRQWIQLSLLNRSALMPDIGIWEKVSFHLVCLRRNLRTIWQTYKYLVTGQGVVSKIAASCDNGRISISFRREILRISLALAFLSVALVSRIGAYPFLRMIRFYERYPPSFNSRCKQLINLFTNAFPSRTDQLSMTDLESYHSSIDQWRKLFECYDLVQAYATDPILPLLTGHPYVAFEHGTIRNIPYEATTQGRLCALSYRLSNWVVITNADNMASARRINIKNFTFVPHPITEIEIDDLSSGLSLRKDIEKKLNSSFLVFHPARQHWSENRHPDWEKGNDIFLEGFARFIRKIEGRAAAVLVEWGASVAESKKLIRTLGIESNILWVPLMPHRKMMQYIQACDLVADQFFLGAFGSILPKALLCGRVSLIYLDPEVHRECFDEMPPILNAKTSDDVFSQLSFAFANKKKIEEIGLLGKQWYQRHHSNDVIASKLINIYSRVL